MCRYRVTERRVPDERGREVLRFGVACGETEAVDLTSERAVAERLAAAFSEQGLAPEHLADAARDFRRDPAFFLACLADDKQP